MPARRISQTKPALPKFFGQSKSEEKRREFDEDRPKFSSDPNFSMKRAVANRCSDLSSTDDSKYYLAKEMGSNSADGDCLSCVSCNSVFAAKPKLRVYSAVPRRNRSSTSGESKKVSTQDESKLWFWSRKKCLLISRSTSMMQSFELEFVHCSW